MTTSKGFNHRAHTVEIAEVTRDAVGMYPFAVEIVFAVPGLGTGDEPAHELRDRVKAFAKSGSRYRYGFHAVCALQNEGGELRARVAVRFRRPPWLEMVAQQHGLQIVEVQDVSGEPGVEVAGRLLAAALAAKLLPEDAQAKAIEEHLRLCDGLWLLAFGRPYFDAKGEPLSGIQRAREVVLEAGDAIDRGGRSRSGP